MTRFLQDLQPYALLIPILAIIVSITVCAFTWHYTKRRGAKELCCRIRSSTPLLSPAVVASGKIRLLVRDRPVANVCLLEMEISNVGNVPIEADEFHEVVGVQAPEGIEFFDADVLEVRPASFRPSVEVTASAVSLVPTVMNQGDSLRVRILASPMSGSPITTGRIHGVREIRRKLTHAGWFNRHGTQLGWSLEMLGTVWTLLNMSMMHSGRTQVSLPIVWTQLLSAAITTCGFALVFSPVIARLREYNVWRKAEADVVHIKPN